MHSIPFEGYTERPESYPVDLPFLPGVTANLTEFEERPGRTVNWFIPSDPDRALAELRSQMEAEGWTEENETTMPNPFGTMTSVEFRKGELKRTLVVSRFGEHNKIMLMEQAEGSPRDSSTA
jgi:hypothetical protein